MDAKTRKIIKRIEMMEAYADNIKTEMSVLKKELVDSGASSNSARKGTGLTPEQKAKVLAKRQKQRLKKSS